MASTAPEAGRLCLRHLGRSTRQTRGFSSSARRRKNGPISVFPPTASPDLDHVLSTLRNSVFLPQHLQPAQRHLIYRKKWQRLLTGEEPVRVDIPVAPPGQTPKPTAAADEAATEKESFVLQPLSKHKDEPRHTVTYHEIIDQLATQPVETWSLILPSLLRELHLPRRKVTASQTEKLVRRASEAGALGVVLECLRRVETLGLQIRTSKVANRLLFSTHERAAKTGFGLGGAVAEGEQTVDLAFARKELDRAIKNAEAFCLMAQDSRHVDLDAIDSPSKSPELFGAVMALVAIRRLLWATENTVEKKAERAAAAAAATADISVELPEGADEAIENKNGETPAEAAAEAVATDGEEVAEAVVSAEADGELFALGKDDILNINEYGLAMLSLSEGVPLECDTSSEKRVRRFLQLWLPVWFGIQVAREALPAKSQLRNKLSTFYEKEVAPTVQKALDAVPTLQHEGKAVARSEMAMHAAYVKFLQNTVLNGKK